MKHKMMKPTEICNECTNVRKYYYWAKENYEMFEIL